MSEKDDNIDVFRLSDSLQISDEIIEDWKLYQAWCRKQIAKEFEIPSQKFQQDLKE